NREFEGRIDDPRIYDFTLGDGELQLLATGGEETPYEQWATGDEAFDGDTNGDGVANGLAFLLGAPGPNADARGLLPTATNDGVGGLMLSFSMLNAARRGAATLSVMDSYDLGVTDTWASTVVPETTVIVGGVSFVITPNGIMNDVTATIDAGQ